MTKLQTAPSGRAVRLRRLLRGMTQRELAQAMSKAGSPVSVPTVSQWETGWTRIPAARLPALARALRCSVSALRLKPRVRWS